MKCLVCGNDNVEQIMLSKNTSHYVQCAECSCFSLFNDKALDVGRYKNDNYMKDLSAVGYDVYANVFNYFRSTINFNIGKETGSFLEFGFANPGILLMLTKEGWDCTGVDLSYYEPIVKEMQDAGISYVRADIRTVELESDKKYDVIWVGHLVEHFFIDDVKLILNKLKSLLSENGMIFISSPDAVLYNSNIPANVEVFIDHMKPWEHVVIYTASAFNEIARECGLQRLWENHFALGNYLTRGEWRMGFTHSKIKESKSWKSW